MMSISLWVIKSKESSAHECMSIYLCFMILVSNGVWFPPINLTHDFIVLSLETLHL